jgi:hypothetical protein
MCRPECIWSLANCCRRSPHVPWTKVEEKNIFLKSRYFFTGCPNRPFSVQNGLCRVFRNLMCRPESIWSLANCCRRFPHIRWTKVEKKTFHHTNRYFFRGSINRPIFAEFESIWVKISHFWGLDITYPPSRCSAGQACTAGGMLRSL